MSANETKTKVLDFFKAVLAKAEKAKENKEAKEAADQKIEENKTDTAKKLNEQAGKWAPTTKPNLPKAEIDASSLALSDEPHKSGSPADRAHDVVEEGKKLHQELKRLKYKAARHHFLRHLRSLKNSSSLRSEENRQAGMEKDEGPAPGQKNTYAQGENMTQSAAGQTGAGQFASTGSPDSRAAVARGATQSGMSSAWGALKNAIQNPASLMRSDKTYAMKKAEWMEKARNPHRESDRVESDYGVGGAHPPKSGISLAGQSVRVKNPEAAKKISKLHMQQQKIIGKPNLPKSELGKAGVHEPRGKRFGGEGVSDMGMMNRTAHNLKPAAEGRPRLEAARQVMVEGAKQESRKKLEELKTQPKPNLPKSELDKHVPGVPDKKLDNCVEQVKGQKGVKNAYAICTSSLKGKTKKAELDKEEKSIRKPKTAGFNLPGLPPSKRQDYPVVEAQVSPKPEGKWPERKQHGVFGDAPMHHKSGTSTVGAWMGERPSKAVQNWAKEQHKSKLAELKAMPKPNLPKTELDKGQVIDMKTREVLHDDDAPKQPEKRGIEGNRRMSMSFGVARRDEDFSRPIPKKLSPGGVLAVANQQVESGGQKRRAGDYDLANRPSVKRKIKEILAAKKAEKKKIV